MTTLKRAVGAAILVVAAESAVSACAVARVVSEPRPRYSTATQQSAWTEQLHRESQTKPRIFFDPLGHLRSVAGTFRLDGSAVAWLEQHREMLGLPDRASIQSVHREPFYRFTGQLDQSVGTRYVFEVKHGEYIFAGMSISAFVSADGSVLLGLYNGFAPAIGGFAQVRPLTEAVAWQIAEQSVGSPLTHLSAIQTWFDPSWALTRVSSRAELHWRLSGVDKYGAVRHAFINSGTRAVTYATPAGSSFVVHQTHQDDSGFVLWDSVSLPNGCTAGVSGCTGRAYEDSLSSRDILPRTVDIWYRLSAPGTPPFVWPFTERIDNGGNALVAVLAHAGTGYPERYNNTYYFPLDTDTVELDPSATPPNVMLRAPSTVRSDVFGHEYGHTILERLKVMDAGAQVGKTQPASFTEAMADFLGIVNENIYIDEKYACCGTDFQILGTRWSKNGVQFVDFAPVSWPMRQGNCNGQGRARVGHAFWRAWTEDANLYGDRPQSVRNSTFRAWWIDIMRSFALVGDFPTITDFYAATASRLGGYTLIEAGVSYRLAYEMELLGLDQGGCF